ncbi:flagellar hook-length control protein FliK [Oscillospiraceae bacterium CM]|nr:flagellar hook-length control protein FliK [Oscillospiraceae bacterium CM]
MQAVSIPLMTATPAIAEQGSETTAGQGLKVNSALRSQPAVMLFNAVLQQEIGKDTGAQAGGLSAELLTALGDTTVNKDNAGEADLSGMLAQLMVLAVNTPTLPGEPAATDGEPAEQALQSIQTAQSIQATQAIQTAQTAQTAVVTDTASRTAPTIGQEAVLAPANAGLTTATAAALPDRPTAGADPGSSADGTGEFFAAVKQAMQDAGQALGAAAAPQAPAPHAVAPEVPATAAMGITANDPKEQRRDASVSLFSDAVPTSASAVGSAPMATETSTDGGFGESASFTRSKETVSPLAAAAVQKGDTAAAIDTSFSITTDVVTPAIENAFDRFVDDVRSIRGSAQEIKIVLEPESLGILTISVLRTENGVSAKIKSENKEVAGAISGHLHKLVAAMQTKGITVDNIDVVYSKNDGPASFTEQGSSQQSFTQQRFTGGREDDAARRQPTSTGATEGDVWQEYGTARAGDSTVDYRV